MYHNTLNEKKINSKQCKIIGQNKTTKLIALNALNDTLESLIFNQIKLQVKNKGYVTTRI